MLELADRGITLSDVVEEAPIDVLIGADVLGRLLTGQMVTLASGLTAVETRLGWTLMGKVPTISKRTDAVRVNMDLLCCETKVENLWDLEAIGIEDAATKLSKGEAAAAAKEVFLESIRVNEEGRYEVRLPWRLDHVSLPSNSDLAKGRLEKLLRQLHNQDLTRKYGDVLKEWVQEGIIEEAPEEPKGKLVHYLPHRPVLKEESSTTKIRPVFDASARQRGFPSLNDCLEKGENLLRLIPDVLLGFRQRRVGVVSDIKATFLQVSVNEADRDALRFWWLDEDGVLKAYRHRRVVFGVNCSPFLLGATIEYHLERYRQEGHQAAAMINQLAQCFYVDNCVTSLQTHEKAVEFKHFARGLLQAGGKSRVAPIKKPTIPRLELLAATIGSRLYTTVKDLTVWKETHFWTDSSTALAWIRREEEWAPFVGNRVREIRQLTNVDSWKHVPGRLNPADLPSRGCTAKQLKEQRWWEGPKWLYRPECQWTFDEDEADEDVIGKERRKRPVVCLINQHLCEELRLGYFSSHKKAVRMLGWVRRFVHNARAQGKRSGELTGTEYSEAETLLWKLVQAETFRGLDCGRLKTLSPLVDDEGLFRLRSRICAREDTQGMRYPVVLPGEHHGVRRMIYCKHVQLCHMRVQSLMSELREEFWILGGRRAIRSAISCCVTCKRFSSKRIETVGAPLPKDRVRDAAVFEICGVDFAGPLLLKNGEKAWVCLYTCAVYRAVHLELTTAMSSAAFMESFRRFVARRGRPAKIISDNGRNFVGTRRLLSELDWKKIQQYTAELPIEWTLIPPSAPWWGGFWERLVGVMKRILRKVLGRASLTYEEMLTVLCDCEGAMNSRPLTAVPCDPSDFRVLTPNSFLRDLRVGGVPDFDKVDSSKLCKRAAYRQSVRDCLRQRFRAEYLGQLSVQQKGQTPPAIQVGQLMLLEDDCKKRLDWPMVRIEEVTRSRDGQVRVVKVRTPRGVLVRPTRRLFPLECDESAVESKEADTTTRVGRVSRKPDRLGYLVQ